jgi:hypothetical protein
MTPGKRNRCSTDKGFCARSAKVERALCFPEVLLASDAVTKAEQEGPAGIALADAHTPVRAFSLASQFRQGFAGVAIVRADFQGTLQLLPGQDGLIRFLISQAEMVMHVGIVRRTGPFVEP